MKKDPQVLLDHNLDCINHINAYTKAVSKGTFLKTDQIQDAVFRRIEIIGEAAGKLPQEFRDANPKIPWKEIIGTRNVLIHDYVEVDKELVWGIVEKHIPDLEKEIKKLSKKEKKI